MQNILHVVKDKGFHVYFAQRLRESDKKNFSNSFPKCPKAHVKNFQGKDFSGPREFQLKYQDDTSQSLLSSDPVTSKCVPKGLQCDIMASLQVKIFFPRCSTNICINFYYHKQGL